MDVGGDLMRELMEWLDRRRPGEAGDGTLDARHLLMGLGSASAKGEGLGNTSSKRGEAKRGEAKRGGERAESIHRSLDLHAAEQQPDWSVGRALDRALERARNARRNSGSQATLHGASGSALWPTRRGGALGLEGSRAEERETQGGESARGGRQPTASNDGPRGARGDDSEEDDTTLWI